MSTLETPEYRAYRLYLEHKNLVDMDAPPKEVNDAYLLLGDARQALQVAGRRP